MDKRADKVLDAKGIACPMPVVKTKKAIEQLTSGQILEIHTTDKGSNSDLTAWVKSGGHELVDRIEDGDVFKFWIRKK